MIKTYAEKHYSSAGTRLFEASIDRFLKEQFPQAGGPEVRQLLIGKLVSLFETSTVEHTKIKSGQVYWSAIDKTTRPDSKNPKYKEVILTLFNKSDLDELVSGANPAQQLPNTIARICKEAYKQGGLLSARDISILLKRTSGNISNAKNRYESKNQEVLPTTATIQDMGSGVTHKAMILRKIILEKKEMSVVRNETNHSQSAIDRYLKDYRRIEMLFKINKDISYISLVTQMSVFLIQQYVDIYYEFIKKKESS